MANQNYNNNKGYATTMTKYIQITYMNEMKNGNHRRILSYHTHIHTHTRVDIYGEPDNNVIKRDLFIYSTKWLSCCCLKHDPIL